MDMKQGHAAWTSSKTIYRFDRKDMQRGHPALTWQEAWTYSKDMLHGHEAQTFSMNMQQGHAAYLVSKSSNFLLVH
jgi:hypothetical protein